MDESEQKEEATKRFIEQAGDAVEKLINQHLGESWKRLRSEGMSSGDLFVIHVYLGKKGSKITGAESKDKDYRWLGITS